MLLLAFHQKLKLKREKAQLTLSTVKRASRIENLKKNIQNRQKYYAGLTAQIDAQANQMKNAFNTQMQWQMNGTFNPLNNSGQGGMFLQAMQQMFKDGYKTTYKDKDGKEVTKDIQGSRLENLYNVYNEQGINAFEPVKEDNKVTGYTYNGETYTADEMALMRQAVSSANQYQSQMQYQSSMMSNQYQNNISIWVEAQKAQIKAEEEQVVDALQYEETMEEMDQAYEEQRLTTIQEELQRYEEMLKEEIKESVPHFGLG